MITAARPIALCLHAVLVAAAAAASSSSASSSGRRESAREAAHYSEFPPTVFAPGGRLYGVERVAAEAMLSDYAGGVGEGHVSCGVLALHCRGDGDGDGEFAVLVGIGATSPYLHRDEAYLECESDDSTSAGDGGASGGSSYLPLEIDETSTSSGIGASPLAVLSPTLVAGAGGRAVDSAVLLRRATEVALSMYSNDNGGVDWFVSHSLEGTSNGDDDGDGSPWGSLVGGAGGVDVSSLARRVADMAQSSTQSLGSRYGRMLSSSLIAVGSRDPTNRNARGNGSGGDRTTVSPDGDSLVLWRVDPTGQFWRLDASAVGRGAVNAESELLERVRSWRTKQTDESDSNDAPLRHDDVRSYLASLAVREAVDVGIDCLVDGIMKSIRKRHANTEDSKAMMRVLEQGLRKRVQAVVVRSNGVGRPKPCIEII